MTKSMRWIVKCAFLDDFNSVGKVLSDFEKNWINRGYEIYSNTSAKEMGFNYIYEFIVSEGLTQKLDNGRFCADLRECFDQLIAIDNNIIEIDSHRKWIVINKETIESLDRYIEEELNFRSGGSINEPVVVPDQLVAYPGERVEIVNAEI